jgi:hypothetical protein
VVEREWVRGWTGEAAVREMERGLRWMGEQRKVAQFVVRGLA